MDTGANPHLHVALSTYIYLQLALDSSLPRSLKNREQRDGLWTDPRVLRPVTRLPGHRGWSCSALSLPLELMQMET